MDEQIRKVVGTIQDKTDNQDKEKIQEKLLYLEKTGAGLKHQNALLNEKLAKLEYVVSIEDAEFKVSVLTQQLARVESTVAKLQASLTDTLVVSQQRAIQPYRPSTSPKRPATVGNPATRPVSRSQKRTMKPFLESPFHSISNQPSHNVSLILTGEKRSTPTPSKLENLHTGYEKTSALLNEPPISQPITGWNVESTPVSTRSKTAQKNEVQGRPRTGRIRSGKPFTDMKTQNRKVLDEMVIFSSKVYPSAKPDSAGGKGTRGRIEGTLKT